MQGFDGLPGLQSGVVRFSIRVRSNSRVVGGCGMHVNCLIHVWGSLIPFKPPPSPSFGFFHIFFVDAAASLLSVYLARSLGVAWCGAMGCDGMGLVCAVDEELGPREYGAHRRRLSSNDAEPRSGRLPSHGGRLHPHQHAQGGLHCCC